MTTAPQDPQPTHAAGAAGIDTAEDPAESVAAVVTAVSGVVALHSGMFGEVGTYLPGRTIPGIRLDAERVDVHVAIAFGTPISVIAPRIRSAVVEALGITTAVHVHIEDILPPSQS